MILLVKFTLLVLGITYIITQSAIGTPVRLVVSKLGRFFAALIYCPACTGFWVGGTLGALGYKPWPMFSHPQLILETAIAGCALMALWKEYGPQVDVWALEQGSDQTQEKTNG